MTKTDLKPCPFCGGEAHLSNWTDQAYVWCECGVKTEVYLHSGCVDKAIKAWNRRAEPERKKGEWIKEDLSGYLTPGGNSIYHCSECGHTEGPWPHPRLTNFCPSCGADMRGEDGKA